MRQFEFKVEHVYGLTERTMQARLSDLGERGWSLKAVIYYPSGKAESISGSHALFFEREVGAPGEPEAAPGRAAVDG